MQEKLPETASVVFSDHDIDVRADARASAEASKSA